MKLYFESLESSKYFKGPGTYSIYAFRGQYTPYDDYEYSDEDELYTDIYLKSVEDLDNIIMRIEGRDGFIFSKAILHESKKRMNEELWDSSRVLDLTRYFLDKYPYADDDQIMRAIKKQMTKEGSTLPSNDSEFRRAYFSARDEYDEDDMYCESLSKKRINENIFYDRDSGIDSDPQLELYNDMIEFAHYLQSEFGHTRQESIQTLKDTLDDAIKAI